MVLEPAQHRIRLGIPLALIEHLHDAPDNAEPAFAQANGAQVVFDSLLRPAIQFVDLRQAERHAGPGGALDRCLAEQFLGFGQTAAIILLGLPNQATSLAVLSKRPAFAFDALDLREPLIEHRVIFHLQR